jgi:4'-phosphopantetheinyl transferase EntD
MLKWKIFQTLTNPEDESWDILVTKTLGEKVHPDRKKGFLLSRQALEQCLQEFGEDPKIPDLELQHHSLLPALPHFTLSLSHSKDCGVALVARREIYRSVGVDIEEKNRVVKDMVRERILHPMDEKLKNIELWCLKEAVFKAIMNALPHENPIEFSSIEIQNMKWLHSDSGLQGDWVLQETHQFILALAFLKN